MNNVLTLDQVRRAAPAAFSPLASEEMSPRYAHVTTATVLDALQQDGWQIVDANQTASRRPEARLHNIHRITLTHPGLPEHPEGRPQMYLGNSGNGTSALRLLGGFLRAACLNQNYVGVKVVGGVFNHRGSGLEDRIVAGARDLRANFDKVINAYELWKQIPVSPEAQLEFAREAVALRWPTTEVDYVNYEAILKPRRTEDVAPNLWNAYNRVQEALVRGGFTATFVDRVDGVITERRTWHVRKITGLTASERINTGLWDLAERTAAGQGALVTA